MQFKDGDAEPRVSRKHFTFRFLKVAVLSSFQLHKLHSGVPVERRCFTIYHVWPSADLTCSQGKTICPLRESLQTEISSSFERGCIFVLVLLSNVQHFSTAAHNFFVREDEDQDQDMDTDIVLVLIVFW